MADELLNQIGTLGRRVFTLGPSDVIAIVALLVSVALFFVTRQADRRRDISAIRPILVFEYQSEGWHIRNVGEGPAMDVIFTRLNGQRVHDHIRLPALARDASFSLHFAKHDNIRRFAATYRDIDGRAYSSDSVEDVSKTYEGFTVERPSAAIQWWKRPASDQ